MEPIRVFLINIFYEMHASDGKSIDIQIDTNYYQEQGAVCIQR